MANNVDYVVARIKLEGALKEYLFKSNSSLVTMADGKTLEASIAAITDAIAALPTGSDVTTAINDAVAAAIASVYKPKGSIATIDDLPELTAANEGNVYNIEAAFTTTADFKEGAGEKFGKGQNVAIVNVGDDENPVYKYDALSGIVDLSEYVKKDGSKVLSTNDFTTALLNKLNGIADSATKVEASGTNGNVKINGAETTVYQHPESHSADMITPTTDRQFLTQAEKTEVLGRNRIFTSATEPTMSDGDIWFQPVSAE